MCPACWTAMILNALAWLSGALGLAGVYSWLKLRYNIYIHKGCKCNKCKKRQNNTNE